MDGVVRLNLFITCNIISVNIITCLIIFFKSLVTTYDLLAISVNCNYIFEYSLKQEPKNKAIQNYYGHISSFYILR